MPGRLPAAVVRLLRWSIPAHRAGQVIADLEDDYARVRHDNRPWIARWWLAREAASIAGAYTAARGGGFLRLCRMCDRDLRLVVRGLRRGPLAACGAAAMLSTGLLAVLLSAGLSQALLFRQVSRDYGDALRRVGTVDRQGRASMRLSYPELNVIRDHLATAARIAVVNMQPVVVRNGATSVQTMVEAVDGQYLALVGARAVVGRGLLSTDDMASALPATVISEPFWRRQFGSSPSVLGRTIELNGVSYTIVGVLDAIGSSSFLGASVDAWIPIAHADALLNRDWRTNMNDRWFTTFALPGGNVAELDARLDRARSDLAQRYPEIWRERRLLTSAATVLTGTQRGAVTTLAGILAGLALLILGTAASNVGGVFLARAAAARRQAAIHLAIGSGRAAIVRRHLIEGAILGLAGAALALAVYVWLGARLADIAVLPTLALRLELPLNATLVAALAAAGALTGMALAAAPALWTARVELSAAMRDGDTRVSGGRGLARMRRLLVSAQVCLALVLMVGALRFAQSLDALRTADVGFNRDRLVAMDFDLEPASTPPAEMGGLAREALLRTAAVAGVVQVAMSNRAPIDQSTPSIDIRADHADGVSIGDATFYLATTGYFDTVGIGVISGRSFTEEESRDAADVVVVNESLATRAWPAGDAVGHAVYLSQEAKTLRVIGVASNSKYRSIDEPPRPHLYRPTPPRLGLTLLARTSSDPYDTLRRLQEALDRVGPGLVGFFPRTLDDHLAIELLPTRAAATAASVLGAMALVFSGVGLYGLVSWFVALRQREIGVRMALGASPRDVRQLVVRQAAVTALPGVIVGVPLAAGLGVLARAALFGVGPFDPAALFFGVAVLVLIVGVAAYVPGRRATRVDPATALRGG